MPVKIYGIPPSHPTHSARLMAEHKGMEPDMVWLLPGLHPIQVRAHGFRHGTVPAMKIDGRKVQGTSQISRALEEARPEPRLFPEDPAERREVEEAERWGDEVFQGVPRRIVRWISVHRPEYRGQLAAEIGLPAPNLVGRANAPVARLLARQADANDETVQATIANLPADLDTVERLLDAGTLGSESPNAADFQIVTTVRTLLILDDIGPLIEDRPSAAWARRVMPEYPGTVPKLLPQEWLEPLH